MSFFFGGPLIYGCCFKVDLTSCLTNHLLLTILSEYSFDPLMHMKLNIFSSASKKETSDSNQPNPKPRNSPLKPHIILLDDDDIGTLLERELYTSLPIRPQERPKDNQAKELNMTINTKKKRLKKLNNESHERNKRLKVGNFENFKQSYGDQNTYHTSRPENTPPTRDNHGSELYPYNVRPFRLDNPVGRRNTNLNNGFSNDNLLEYDLSTYESRLRLDNNIERPKLSSSEIEKLCCFVSTKTFEEPCVICTENCKEGEEVITLHCLHAFHKDCIVKWLKKSRICPICRIDAVHKIIV